MEHSVGRNGILQPIDTLNLSVRLAGSPVMAAEMMRPFEVKIAPTAGFGLVSPNAFRASPKATRIKRSCSVGAGMRKG